MLDLLLDFLYYLFSEFHVKIIFTSHISQTELCKIEMEEVNMTHRTENLKRTVFSHQPAVCPERAHWLTVSYQETEGQPQIIRRAKAFYKLLENMTVRISDGELIVGNFASNPRSAPLFPEFGIAWLRKELDWLPNRPLEPFQVPEQVRSMVGELESYWTGKTHEDLVTNLLHEILPLSYQEGFDWDSHSMNQVISCAAHVSTGDGHILADYGMVMNRGLRSIIQEAQRHIAAMDADAKQLDIDKKLFYEAAIIVCEGMIIYAHRLAEEALSQAQTTEPSRRRELLLIAENCRRVPEYPAETFMQALQAYWLTHLGIQLESNGHSISPGRFDQYLWPFYQHDLELGQITREAALELIECFFIKCNELIKVREWAYTQFMSGFTMFQTLVIGGVKRNGSDAVNELSYLTLDATRNLKLPQPTTVVRVSRENSDAFLEYAGKTLVEHGGGLPAFFGDSCGIEMLTDMGSSIEDARDWAIVGCCEPVVPGKFITVSGGMCHVNLLKCLELAMHNGKNPSNGITMHSGRGELRDFCSIEELIDAYKDQLKFYLQFPHIMDSVTCKAYELLTPTPFISTLIDGRLDSGMDISRGEDGMSTHNLLNEAHGSVNVGNAFAAVQKLVFDEKRLTMGQLQELIDADFQGIQGERMRQLLINGAPKYGNNDDFVDNFVNQAIAAYVDELTSYRPLRGGHYGPSTQGLTANIPQGASVGATPDGRKAGAPLADNTSPTPGTDTSGPTAVVLSATKIGQRRINNGLILNVKFHPSALQDHDRIVKFRDYLRTYFDLDGFQVQFNVVNQETLREAQKHPEEYQTLVVKVAGYSAFFSTLDERLQNQIIERTSHML